MKQFLKWQSATFPIHGRLRVIVSVGFGMETSTQKSAKHFPVVVMMDQQ